MNDGSSGGKIPSGKSPSRKSDFLEEVGKEFQDFSSIELKKHLMEESVDTEVSSPLKNGKNDKDNHEMNGKEKEETNEQLDKQDVDKKNNLLVDSSSEKLNGRFVALKDFDLLKVIGVGAFGKVLQVKNKKSGGIFAMKVISKRLLRKKVSYVENVQEERNILTKIRHPFIVSMRCSFQTKQKLFIIMDFCAGGELFLRIGREGIFQERTAAFFLAEIILALEHLHGKGILHRDLKPENILLNSDGHLALTDFGLAKDFSAGGFDDNSSPLELSRVKTICGTGEYMAPEMIARKGYGKAADFWSLGCISYEMMSGKPPFESNKGTKDLFRKILNERVRMPDGLSPSAHRLLKGLLNRDASKRLGASKGTMFVVGGVTELKQIDFFTGLDWRLLEMKEIDPPEMLISENGDNLEHFHDDFLKMSLPRSVREMSKADFKPTRCASTTFRGFSFVQEDFDLPDRPDDELEHYWNNVDADGYSLSDCASSVFDEDIPPVSDKKKRPPRKKKKNKNKDNDLLTMELKSHPEHDDQNEIKQLADEMKNENVSQDVTSSVPLTNIDVITSSKASDTSKKESINVENETTSPMKPNTKIDEFSKKESKQPNSTQNPKKVSEQKPKETIWQEVVKKPTLRPKAPQAHKLNYSLNSKPYALDNKSDISKAKLQTTTSHQRAHKPQPGSWAARAATSKTHSTMTPGNGLPQSSVSTTNRSNRQTKEYVHKKIPIDLQTDKIPPIAVQEAFWPSLGGNDKKKNTPINSKKLPSESAVWSKKINKPMAKSNAWK